MNRLFRELFICRCAVCLALWCLSLAGQAETFRVATYNVDNYLDATSKGRRTKTVEAKRKVAEMLLSARPDVVALQEMGGDGELKELQDSLRAGGLDLSHRELVFATDTNIHVAVLSRFPVVASRPQTNASFLLSGRRFKVGRGFGEFDIQVTSNYSFTLITAHLKSRRIAPVADQAEQRLE